MFTTLLVLTSCGGAGSSSEIQECNMATLKNDEITSSFSVTGTSATDWTNLLADMQTTINANAGIDADIKFSFIDSKIDMINKFRGGVLTKYNYLVFMPQTRYAVQNIYAYNPRKNYFCRAAQDMSDISGVWSGGTTLPDGSIISFPIEGTKVLKTDPDTLTTTVIYETEGTFGSQVLAPNGFIYGVPSSADHVLKFDPSTNTATKLGAFAAGGNKYYSSIIAPNGKVYGIPLYADQVVEIDTSNDAIALIGASYSGVLKWAGAVLATNGKIYAAPDDYNAVLEIDPDTQGTRTIATELNAQQKWSFGFLGPDGKVYFAPDHSATALLQFDPSDDSMQTFGELTGGDKWNGVIQMDGDYYAIPDSNQYILKIDFQNMTKFESRTRLSPFYNKY